MTAKTTIRGFISKGPETKQQDLSEGMGKSGKPYLKGKIYWADGKNEDKTIYSDIKFVAYGAAIDAIKNNRAKMLEFKDCPLKKVSFKGEDGKSVNYHELAVFNAFVAEKVEKTVDHWQDKTKANDDYFDDDCPF